MADNPKIQAVDLATKEQRQVDASPSFEEDFRAGKVGLVPGTTVPVVMDGQVADVDASKLESVLSQGWKVAGKQDVLMDEARSQPLRAAVEGGARSLTLGFSDLVAREAGADQEALQARAATAAAGAGEGAGMLAQAAYGLAGAGIEGASAGARALQLAMKPTMLVDDLGRMVAARTEAALASATGRPLLSKALGYGAAGVAEGVVTGIGQGISEAALGQPDLNAEVLLSAAAEGAKGGALWGGVGGVILGTIADRLGNMKSRPLRQGVDELNEELAVHGIDVKDKTLLGKYMEALGNRAVQGEEEAVAKLNARRGQAVINQGESAVMETASKLSNNLDEIQKINQELDTFTNESRAKLLRNEIPDTAGDAAAAKGGAVMQQIRSAVDGLDLDSELLGLGTGGGKRLGSKLSAAADEMEDRVFKAAGVDRKYMAQVQDGYDAAGMPVMRQVEKQRTLEDLAGLYENGRPVAVAIHDGLDSMRVIAEQAVKSAKTPELAERFTRVRDAISSALTSEETFGDAAKMHKAMDTAAAKRADLTAYLDKNFRSENGKIIPESVRNHVASLINVDADTSIAKVKDFVQTNRDLMNMLEASGADVRALRSQQARLNNLAGRVDSMEKPLRERVAVFNAAKRLNAARANNMAGAPNVMSYGLGAAIHSATGLSGAPLALGAAGAFTALTDPVRSAYNRAKIGAAINDRMTQLNNSVKRLVTDEGADGVRIAKGGHYAAVGSRLTAQITGGKSYSERAKAFQERIDQVQRSATPMGQQQLGDADPDFSNAAPEHANALAAKQDVATRMLLQAIPVPIMTPGGLGTRSPIYTDSAMRRFARLDRAIQDPRSIIEDAMRGNVTAEHREVLHTLYPQLALTLTNQVTEHLGDGKSMSPARERAIKQLLTPPGQNDMQRLTALQDVIAAPLPAPTPGTNAGGGPMTVDPNSLSAADRLLQ